MRLTAVLLALAFALLANPAWCLDACCPLATAAGPSSDVLSAPECCSPAATTGACPLSLHRSANPAIDLTGANEANPTVLTASAPFVKIMRTASTARSASSSPPGGRTSSALHAQLLI
jgi:hypothetical protein